MKKSKLFLTGIPGILLVFGLILTACGDKETGDPSGGGGGQVATPTASPAAGAVAYGTQITLTTSTAGATIYYTTNGATPTASSTQYADSNKPAITAATTIKAIAVKEGLTSSGVLTTAYTLTGGGPPATPTASPAAGAVDSGTQITLTSTAGATIYYTTDGTTPTDISTRYEDSSKPAITAATTIKAIAVKEGLTSDVLTAAYTLTGGYALTWTAVTVTAFDSSSILDITYGGGKFIAVGESGKVAYSTDGITWTAVSDPGLSAAFDSTNRINGIAYGGKFVAVGSKGKAAYSTDGVTWEALTGSDTTFGSSGYILDITYGGASSAEKFVAVGESGKAAYSTDGVTWAALTGSDTTFGSGTGSINDIAYGGGKFVAVGRDGHAAYSTDGVTWAALTGSDTTFGFTSISSYINGIAYGGASGAEKFVAVGASNHVAYSTDGVTWMGGGATFGTSSNSISSIAYGGGKFVAVGSKGKAAYSTNGVKWTAVTNTTFGSSNDIYSIAYGGGRFVAVGSDGKAAYSNNQE